MPAKGEKMSKELKAKLAEGRAKAKARKEANQANTNTPTNTSTNTSTGTPTDTIGQDPDVNQLTKMVLELKQQLEDSNRLNQAYFAGTQSVQSAQSTTVNNGRLVGTTAKFSVDPKQYEDPRDRLRAEPRLRRVAFDTNYELDFDVSVTSYDTKDGLMMKEPKFTLSLNQIVLDDDGEPTTGRIGKARIVFFEDPQTAVLMANKLGIPIDDENEAKFLNDMRYIRVRDWLYECFWPPKVETARANKREMVVGGQIVDVWEKSSENASAIPFDTLNSKLKS